MHVKHYIGDKQMPRTKEARKDSIFEGDQKNHSERPFIPF
jgi:hypothetical protein